MRNSIPILLSLIGFGLGFVLFRGAAGQAPAAPLSSAFTYQGLLEVAGEPADGLYDFRFRLFDAASGGNQVGDTVTIQDVTVSAGRFSVILDVGPGAFAGEARWLELAVRKGGSMDAYTTLAGRQPLTPAPYALRAAEAGSVAWGGVTNVPPGFADGVDDVGLTGVGWTDVQNRPAGLDDGDDDTTYTAGTGLALAGTQFSAAGSPYANLLVVAQSGGDFSSVQAALDSIGDASPANPYLVYVAPGVYDERVTLKPYVTLEGAGEETTIIRGTGGSVRPRDGSDSATLVGADNTALRHLTVESDGTGQSYALAIYNNASSPEMHHVTASAADGSSNNYGVYNDSSSPQMTDVNASAAGGFSSVAVLNVAFAAPKMTDVTAAAIGASAENVGVANLSSGDLDDVEMRNVTASAAGGTYNYGVYNLYFSPQMAGVTASASGGTQSYGVYNDIDSSPEMSNVIARGANGSSANYGVYNDSSSTPTIRHSQLQGSTASVSGGGAAVANSQLVGPIGTGLTCFNNYDANLNAVVCP